MKTINTKIIHTHDKEANWEKYPEFIPSAGEVIVYDIDGRYSYERFKIGDGKTKINELPFSIERNIQHMFDVRDNMIYIDGGRI